MKGRLFTSLAFLALFSSCVNRSAGPAKVTGTPQPEITIHAPIEQVRLSLIVQFKGEGSSLESQTDGRLIFVRQVSKPLTYLKSELKPTGAPYVRTIYSLTPLPHGTHITVDNELVDDYGAPSEHIYPLDSPALWQAEQRGLLREQANVERR